jgi:ParB-like chromosome segregation protein Spo0J
MARATEFFDAQVEAEFETGPGTFLETGTLTDTRLGELLAQITGLIEIHKDLKAEAERRLYRGDSVPGFQLVNYSPPRKWRDGAEEALAEDENLWARKLITPTAAEKLLGEEYSTVEALVDKPDKRPVVAKVGDRRSVWQGKPPEAMFADESGDE